MIIEEKNDNKKRRVQHICDIWNANMIKEASEKEKQQWDHKKRMQLRAWIKVDNKSVDQWIKLCKISKMRLLCQCKPEVPL